MTNDRQWQGFGVRLQSAALLGGIVLILVYQGGMVFSVAVVIFALIMIYEWDGLCSGNQFGAIGVGHVLAIGTAVLLAVADMYSVALGAVLVSMLALGGMALLLKQRTSWPVLGIAYVAVPCISLVWLRATDPYGMVIVCWSFAVVWAADTGAYIFGKSIGGPRLAPNISPNKTWAGLVGGTLCGTLAGAAVAAATGLAPIGVLATMSCGLSFASQGGDLLESALKRHFGAKDSGALIPGHGGILDRVDGLIFVWPTMAVAQLVHGGSLLPWVPR